MQQIPLPIDPVLQQAIDFHPLTVAPETPVMQVIEFMSQAKNKRQFGNSASGLAISDCALITQNNQLLGILTSGDVVRLIATGQNLSQVATAAVMSHPIVALKLMEQQETNAFLQTIVQLTDQHCISQLPLVDEHNRIIGLAKAASIYRYLNQERQAIELCQLQQQLQSEKAERKQLERSLKESQSCLRLINSIATRTVSGMPVEQVIQTTVQEISQHFKDLRVAYSTIDAHNLMSVICTIEPPEMPPLAGISMDLTAATEYLDTLRQLQPVIVEDLHLQNLPDWLKAELIKVGVRAFLDVPLCHSQQLVGVLCFDSPEIRQWSEYEIAILTEIADYLSLVLQEADMRQERLRAEASLMQMQQTNALLATAIEKAADAIEITDANKVIEYVNPACEEVTGYSREELIGNTLEELFRSTRQSEAFYQSIENSLANRQIWRGNLVARRKDGSYCYQEATIAPVYNARGELEHYVAIKRDVTERRRVEEALRLTQFSIDHAVDAAFWVQSDGKFTYVNKAACRALGYTYVELLLMSIREVAPYFPRAAWLLHWKSLKEQKFLRFETYFRTKGGRFFPVEFTINYLEFNGREYGFAFARDITQRRQAEEAMRLKDQAITASSNGIVIVDARSPGLPIISVNPAFEKLSGYTAEEVVGQNCRFLQGHDRDQDAIRELRQAMQTERNCTVILRNYRKDGSLFWNELSISPIHDLDGNLTHFVGVQTDITDRKHAEDSLREVSEKRKELEYIVNQSPVVVFLWQANVNWTVEFVSENVRQFGYTPDDFYSGHISYAAIIHPDDLDRIVAEVNHYIQRRQDTYSQEYRVITQSGEVRWINDLTWIRRNDAGLVTHYQGIVIDITERKQAEERLKASLEEKELLLKEVHHRVKNNLQVISSIFSLQSQYIEDPEIQSILSESQNRIRSMALIHEKLYQSDSLARIDFAEYIQNLTSNLFSSYNISSNLIRLKLSITDVALNIDTAIPCGLLINELVSNSLKHAFPNGQSGEIRLHFGVDTSDRFHLEVKDTGIGLPEHWESKRTNSLGLRLVRALTRQLNGKLDVNSDHGSLFAVTFPKPKERKQFG